MADKKKIRGLAAWKELRADQPGVDPSPEQVWEWTGGYRSAGPQPDSQAAWDRLHARMDTAAEPAVSGPSVRHRGRSTRVLGWVAAASVMLALGIGIYTGTRSGADMRSVATGAGETRTWRLADGTEVTLNETSEIAFPEDFADSERSLSLVGEAYFNVVRQPGKPFTVRTGAGEVRVLGTAFNVRVYPEEERLEVYVEHGKVAVSIPGRDKAVVIRPGELLAVDRTAGRAEVRRESAPNALAWKDGRLQFRNATLSEILSRVSQQFGPTFRLEGGQALQDCPFTVQLTREAVGEGLQAISMMCPVRFELQSDGTYLVTGNCCR
jgi:transmembrane sensor